MGVQYKYNSLEDFLISFPLNIDGVSDDGWGAKFPVKGIELEATILFADISSFSARTLDLNPIETLIYVNNFFSWISAESLIGSTGIIDKYIGDEVMVVFANEFGSKDHFVEALQVARKMMDIDALSFMPHIGVASGKVVIGYVGTPLKYNCSVFGNPVAVAARCGAVKSEHSKSIVFPSSNWKPEYDFETVMPEQVWLGPDGTELKRDNLWEMQKARVVEFKNMPSTEILEITSDLMHFPSVSATERSQSIFKVLKESNFYRKTID